MWAERISPFHVLSAPLAITGEHDAADSMPKMYVQINRLGTIKEDYLESCIIDKDSVCSGEPANSQLIRRRSRLHWGPFWEAQTGGGPFFSV